MGGPVPTLVAFVLAIRRNHLRMVIKERSRPGTAKRPGQRWGVLPSSSNGTTAGRDTHEHGGRAETPQAREPICARIKATNSLARV